MKKESVFKIERLFGGEWVLLHGFTHMRKSFADGAWNMLTSHYNQKAEHRLLKDNVVVASCGKQELKLSCGVAEKTKEDAGVGEGKMDAG